MGGLGTMKCLVALPNFATDREHSTRGARGHVGAADAQGADASPDGEMAPIPIKGSTTHPLDRPMVVGNWNLSCP